MKKGKLVQSQQQISSQKSTGGGGPQQQPQLKQAKQDIPKKQNSLNPSTTNSTPINIPNIAEASQKIRKQSTQIILPSINRTNYNISLSKRQTSASRERKTILLSGTNSVCGDEGEGEKKNYHLLSNRKLQRPQSFIIKKRDEGKQTGFTLGESNNLVEKHVNENNLSLAEEKKNNFEDILYNSTAATTSIPNNFSDKIKFNPWKRQESKKEENYHQLLASLNNLKKKHKEQVIQFQQKHHSIIIDNNSDMSEKEKQNCGEEEKQSEKLVGEEKKKESEDLDRNIWKRKKINDKNQMVEECSSIERELKQINFLQSKNQKAISDYISTQNSLLKLNLQIKKPTSSVHGYSSKERNQLKEESSS